MRKLKEKFHSGGGKTIALVSGTNLINSIVAIVSGLVIARWMLPEELGVFNALSIFTSYIILIQLGIPSGMSRDLPYYFGQGNTNHATDLAATAKFFMMGLALISFTVCLLLAIYFVCIENYKYAAGAFVVGVTSAQALYVTKYLKLLYRTNNHFNLLSKIDLINTVVNLVSIVLVYNFLFYGLCLRAILLALVEWYFVEKWKPLNAQTTFDRTHFKNLLKVGMPIYFVANVYGLWPTFQRTLILSLLGAKGLGLYALANIVQGMLGTFNNAIASVSFPKMSLAYGQGASIKTLLKIPLSYFFISVGIYSFILLVGWPLFPYVVKWVLPNYEQGIEAAQWMFPVALVSSFGIFANLYMVIKKNHHRLISYTMGILVWFGFISLHSINAIADLVVFSQALLLGMIVIVVIDGFFFFSYLSKEKNEM